MFLNPPVGVSWAGWWYLVSVGAIVFLIFASWYLVYRDDKLRERLCVHEKRRQKHKTTMDEIKAQKQKEIFERQRQFDSQIGVATFYHVEK